ncbi:MAG: NAD-dependent epimerase/dehydratase family protein [Merismopedia sp. SIO2A8]|nr:NAD-dependent epimerase/dehydratase family protein [Merismopedia sp. SIO2A8]
MASILIIGGRGRIGSAVCRDILQHTDAYVTITRRAIADQPSDVLQRLSSKHSGTYSGIHSAKDVKVTNADHRISLISLDVNDEAAVAKAIAPHDIVIHCAGPFHHRPALVLQQCIALRVNYLDVSDCVPFTRRALAFHSDAQAAGITAIINTGVFPGISNSIARLCVEGFEQHTGKPPQSIRLYYGVAGSGGAGVTVMRTTFLGLQHPFKAWIKGQWQRMQPYSDRQQLEFPPPLGKTGVYWYDVPETVTLAESFPVQTVVTKFGSVPDWYNHLTWAMARGLPKPLLHSPFVIEALSRISYAMTQVSDRFSGTGIAMQVDASASADPNESTPSDYRATLVHPDTAIAAGAGTGSLAQLLLAGRLSTPGVHPVEAVLPTELFQEMMQQRQITILHPGSPHSD